MGHNARGQKSEVGIQTTDDSFSISDCGFEKAWGMERRA